MVSYSQKQLREFKISTSKEWILTDGDGGYASSTVAFMNTRRQHAMLAISTSPPVRRFTLLNKVDEEVIVDGKSFMLGTNHYPGTIFPEGFKLLSKFAFDHFPQLTFDLEGAQLVKKVLMPRRASSIYLHYENNSKKAMILRLLPLISFRWRDSVRKAGDGFLVDELPDGVRIISEMNLPKLYLKLSQIYSTSPESHWYYEFIYDHDGDFYKVDREDLFNIGFWETELEPGKSLTFAASTRDLAEFDYDEIESRHIESIDSLRASTGLPKRYVHLSDAASNHLSTSRAIRTLAIVEGFPYGGVSLKDSLLSLDGMAHAAGRRNYGLEFLNDLVTNQLGGALPSTIEESTGQIKYDDPQIPLFFAIALKRCAEREGSADCMKRYVPALEDAVENLLQNCLGGSKLHGTQLLDLSGGKEKGLYINVRNASANALLYNLLKILEEAKANAESLTSYGDIATEIEQFYFERFFNSDCSFKGYDGDGELMVEMVHPLILPYTPLTSGQREGLFKFLSGKFLESVAAPHIHSTPGHSCNLMLIYLTEAGADLGGFEDETARLKELLVKLVSLQEFTNCVDGVPRCGLDLTEHNPQDLSSAVVTGEAIRVIKKLKLK